MENNVYQLYPQEIESIMFNALFRVAFAASMISLIWMTALIVARYPDNHGAGFNGYYWVYLFLLVSALVGLFLDTRFSLMGVFLAFFGFLFIFIVDRYNITVDYELWTKRGMPGWGEVVGKKRVNDD